MEDNQKELLFLLQNYLAINNSECLKAVRIYLERQNISWHEASKYLELNGFSNDDMIVSKEERQYYLEELNSWIDYA